MAVTGRHAGSWQDTSAAAFAVALAEVHVAVNEYIICQYADGFALEPLEPEGTRIDVEVRYSEARDQYQAVLRRTASHAW